MKTLIAACLLASTLVCASEALAADAAPASAPSTAAAKTVSRKFTRVALGNPRSIAVDSSGTLYVGDLDGTKIHTITLEGRAGAVGQSAGKTPFAVAIGRDGKLYSSDADGNTVIRFAADGAASEWAKMTEDIAFNTPTSLTADAAGNVFVANNAANVILKITPAGVVSVFAGKTGETGSVDGTGSAARFTSPRGIAIDGKDNLYVADEANCNIRKITPAGVVTTLAGSGTSGAADGTGAAASFAAPRALAAGADGTVYVADTDNHAIRKITAEGVVTTFAGKAGEVGGADGKAGDARFSEPRGIAVDAAGSVYVADTGNTVVRQITPDGVVTTIAAAEAPAPAATPATSVGAASPIAPAPKP